MVSSPHTEAHFLPLWSPSELRTQPPPVYYEHPRLQPRLGEVPPGGSGTTPPSLSLFLTKTEEELPGEPATAQHQQSEELIVLLYPVSCAILH